jgi:hypothetical protein
MRDGLANQRLRLWHLARMLGRGAEASQRRRHGEVPCATSSDIAHGFLFSKEFACSNFSRRRLPNNHVDVSPRAAVRTVSTRKLCDDAA